MGEHTAPNKGIDPKIRFYAYCASFGILIALGAAGIIDGDYINAINFVIAGICGVAALNVPDITKEK
jgi:hypothetical protein